MYVGRSGAAWTSGLASGVRTRQSRPCMHHRHDGALDCHGMNCSVLAPRCEAFNLSSQEHLPANA